MKWSEQSDDTLSPTVIEYGDYEQMDVARTCKITNGSKDIQFSMDGIGRIAKMQKGLPKVRSNANARMKLRAFAREEAATIDTPIRRER